MYSYGCEIDYRIEKLTHNSCEQVKDFDCGNQSINHYLKVDAKDDDTVTYLFIDNSDGSLLAFASIRCSGIRSVTISKGKEYANTRPAIEIKYFAVDSKYHKLSYSPNLDDEHYYFSDQILMNICKICRTISEEHVTASYLILYSVPDAQSFYSRNSFGEFEDYMQHDEYRHINGCVPMFLGIA